MGSCSSRGQSDNIQESSKISKKSNSEIEASQDKREQGALKKRLSVNYHKIPNKIHRRDSRFQQGTIQDDEIYGLVGLNNLGNTCFMNSALQCLSNVPPLCDYFLSRLHEKEINYDSFLGSKGQITSNFGELMLDMWSADEDCIKPSKFLRSIGNYGPQFADGSQQDSHEFLAFLMDILHEDLNRVKKKPYIEGKDYNGNNYEQYAKESWSEYLQRNRSIIVDLFQGQTKSTLKCLKCSTVSHKFETFMYLSVPIPDKKNKNQSFNDSQTFTLSQCIQEFTKEEKLERGELWFCPKCKKHQESTKKIDLWKMPNILIIHLKRFEFNKNRRCKLSNLIDFPLKDFDISNLTGGKQRDVPIYDLFAVSNHGGTLSSGHYTSYAKNRIDQNWYLFNDTKVQQVQDPDNRIKCSEAYVLFYSKTSVDEFFRQTLTAPESWPHFFSEEKSSEENSQEEAKVNDEARYKRKRNSKMFTYKFNNQIIDKKEVKTSNNQTNSNQSNNSNSNNARKHSSVAAENSKSNQNSGKNHLNVQNSAQLQMINSVEDDNFQGNLDDSFNNEQGVKPNKNLNTSYNKQKQQQISPSTIKVRSSQQFDQNNKVKVSNQMQPSKNEGNYNNNGNKQKDTQTLKNISQDEMNVSNNANSNSNKQFFQNPKFQQLQVLQTGQSNDNNYNINKSNTKFQYNIIKSKN